MMPVEGLARVTEVLQISVTPVVLISGIGLLLLSMTNRLGRVVDRARALKRGPGEGQAARRAARRQIRILYRRAELLRISIVAASMSILLTAVLILALFLEAAFRLPITWLLFLLFAAVQVALIVSLLYFLKDLTLSLMALRMEIGSDGDAG